MWSVEACFSVQCIFGNPLTLTQIRIVRHIFSATYSPPHILCHTFCATHSLPHVLGHIKSLGRQRPSDSVHSPPHTHIHTLISTHSHPHTLIHTLSSTHFPPHILTHTFSSTLFFPHTFPHILIHTVTRSSDRPIAPPHNLSHAISRTNRVRASTRSQPRNMSTFPKAVEYTCDISLKELRNMNKKEHDDSVPGRVERKLAKNEFIPDIWLPRFVKVQKEHSCVAVKDKNGVLLAFRLQVPAEFMNTLNHSNADLPHGASSPGRRGKQVSRHYALWADFSRHPYMSGELLRDGEKANQWLEGNAPLFKYLGRHFFH